MKNTPSFLLLMLSCFGCSQEPEHGRPLPTKPSIDWEPANPSIYSTNVSVSSPLVIRYNIENLPNSPPLIDQDILPRVELKNKTLDKLYTLDAKLTYGDRGWESYVELSTDTMEHGSYSIMLDGFQRQETIEYPISVGNSDAPVLVDIRYRTGTENGLGPESIIVMMRFSEPINFNTDAIQILSKGSTYKEHTTYTNNEMPGNLVQMTIYHEPGTALAGTTLKFSIDGSAIVSPISRKSLVPITESAFDLSDRLVYTDKMQRQDDVMVFEQVLPPVGGGILWGVDLTPDGLRARAAGN